MRKPPKYRFWAANIESKEIFEGDKIAGGKTRNWGIGFLLSQNEAIHN